MPEPVRLVVVAATFCTRLPLPRVAHHDTDLARALPAFPLIGLVVAGTGIVVRALAAPWWGPGAATVLAVAAMVAVTGALHEDAAGDAADGLWGGADPAARLAIIKDSRLGTYGVVAVAGLLGLQVALLAPLGMAEFARAVLAAHVTARAAPLLLAGTLPAARADGAGARAVGPPGAAGVVVAVVTVGATLAGTLGWWAPLPALAGAGALVAYRALVRRRVGGWVGDLLGAAVALAHLVVLLAAVAVLRAGPPGG